MDHIKKHQELIKGQIYNSYNALEKSEDNDIEKGGAGSRGGKVIGHTRSGKPIYASKGASHYKDFSKEDHHDASTVHALHLGHNGMGMGSKSYDKAKDNRDSHMDAAGVDHKQVHDHKQNYEVEKHPDNEYVMVNAKPKSKN